MLYAQPTGIRPFYERNAGFEQFTQPQQCRTYTKKQGPGDIRQTDRGFCDRTPHLAFRHHSSVPSLSGMFSQSPRFPARLLSPLVFRHVFSAPRFPARFLSPLAFRHVFSVPSLSGTFPQSPRFPARFLGVLAFRNPSSVPSLSGTPVQSKLVGRKKDAVNRYLEFGLWRCHDDPTGESDVFLDVKLTLTLCNCEIKADSFACTKNEEEEEEELRLKNLSQK